MKIFRTLALGAALLTSSVWAFTQDSHAWQYQDRDDRAEYRHGYDQGREDARSGRRFRPASNERDYRAGYEAGYNSVRQGGVYDRGRPNGPYGNPGYGAYGNWSRIAQESGFRDGRNDGAKDRATGHSFRPTQGDNYKNAPGYNSSMGDRQQYKNMYRQAYQQGYQQGYNGRR